MMRSTAIAAALRRARPVMRQSGVTLIELMIAIGMGLFLLLGIAGVVFSMNGSFRSQDQLTQTAETQRFMLSVLNNTIHNAGFFPDPVGKTPEAAFPAAGTANTDGTTFAVGQIISGTGTIAFNSATTINVRFESAPNDGLLNCLGDSNTGTTNIVYTSTFKVNASNQLTCEVRSNGGAVISSPLVLVDNVIAMQVAYGVDTDSDGSVDTYKYGADMSAANWLNVGSVRLTIRMKDLITSTSSSTAPLPDLMHTITLMN